MQTTARRLFTMADEGFKQRRRPGWRLHQNQVAQNQQTSAGSYFSFSQFAPLKRSIADPDSQSKAFGAGGGGRSP
jgi:hypothetical protein